MHAFPSSVESHLREANFTGTEILVLRHVCGGRSFSLRELAAKTGKSTGVLDQAIKKLTIKRIINRETINGSPKYGLVSLEAIGHCLRRSMDERCRELRRRERDVDQFLASMSVSLDRPIVEHFAGEDGVVQAYRLLLQEADTEILHFRPSPGQRQADPLQAFKEQYVRERRRRRCFLRVITHDTPAGRRLRDRDSLEYRRTVLVPEDTYPFTVERLITKDVFVCMNEVERKACALYFPEFAASERRAFEAAWRHGGG